jgi:hypothetical protein
MKFESEDIALDDLLLDPNNCRFLDNKDYKPIFLSTVKTLPTPLASTWVAQEIRDLYSDIPKAK